MRAGERVYRTLRDDIQQGVLSPGAVLAEVEQAARLGVSRTPLREALDRLEAEGLAVQRSPRVTVVADVDLAQIRDLFAVRRALEESAARLAAVQPADARDPFPALAAAFERADATDDVAAYYARVAELDAAIEACVANDFLARSLQPVRAHLGRVRRLASDRPERLRASAGEHALIARAIAAGDPDLAAHATHVHLHHALASIERTLAPATTDRTPERIR
ncbi:GntR family transcriptional regulator [Agrococcus jejuensis]|uniref:DNA-binding transcriptional regulator, GntR family n=1 Tax=Agrococcus jejuensis TaxID=399736 RepID=A0A1G8GXI5_9MICO|nr:GntR family transcriptional regulator [Agrococcus jejuensis]SDH99059.1 DNA-binding transcriptional regulator, GntR family [Agrococcus jejuensis]